MKKRKAVKVVTGLGITTVVAGWVMWLRDMNQVGFGDWVTFSFGPVLTIGGVLATITAFVGAFGVGRKRGTAGRSGRRGRRFRRPALT